MILNGFCLKGAPTHSNLHVSERFNTVFYVKNYYQQHKAYPAKLIMQWLVYLIYEYERDFFRAVASINRYVQR